MHDFHAYHSKTEPAGSQVENGPNISEGVCYSLNVCVSQVLLRWTPTSARMMVLGHEAFAGWLGHVGGGLRNGIHTFIKKTHRGPLHGRRRQQGTGMNQEEDSHQNMTLQSPDLGLPSLQKCEKWMSVAYKLPSLWIYYTQNRLR